MANPDPILDQSLKCLRWHLHQKWGDRHPLDVLNRLLAKNIRPIGWTNNTHLDIQSHQISSKQEQWTVEQLSPLTRHGDPTDGNFDSPIIVAEYEGVQRLLDGNHRINYWIQERDTRLHTVNIHTIEGRAEFVELPASATPMP